MATKINIEVNGYPLGNPGDPVVHPYSVIDGASPTVNLSLTDETGITQFFWSFISKPVGSVATMQDATTPNASFSPDMDLPGTYLVKCLINNGSSEVKNGLGFETEVLGIRIPSAYETNEFDSLQGWDPAMQDFMRKVDENISVSAAGYWGRSDGAFLGGEGYYLVPGLWERVAGPVGTQEFPGLVLGLELNTGLWKPHDNYLAISLGGEPGIQFFRYSEKSHLETYDVTNSNYRFVISHTHLGSGAPAELEIIAAGTDSNVGGRVDIIAQGGPTSGTVQANLSAVDGGLCLVNIDAISTSDTTTYMYLTSETAGIPYMGISCLSSGSGTATLRIVSESAGGGASLLLGCNGATYGRLQVGEYNTNQIAFLSADIYGSTVWTGNYLDLISSTGELDAYFSEFGEASIVAAIVAAATAGGGGGQWQRNGTTLSPLVAGDIVRAGVGSSAAVGYGFEGDVGTGFYQSFSGEIGIALSGNPDTYFGEGEPGGLYGDRPSFMGEEPMGIISYSEDSSNQGAADLYIAAIRYQETPTLNGESVLWMESVNLNEAGTGSSLTLLSEAVADSAIVDISSLITGDTAASVLSTVSVHASNESTGEYTDAEVRVYAETVNAGVARVLLGNDTTDAVGFSDVYLENSTLGVPYIPFSDAVSDWEDWGYYFGSTWSILGSIGTLFTNMRYNPTGSTPISPSAGAFTINCTEGEIFNVSIDQNITSVTLFDPTINFGNTLYGRKITLVLSFTGSYTVNLDAFNVRWPSGYSNISGSSGDFYIIHLDYCGGARGWFGRIDGPSVYF